MVITWILIVVTNIGGYGQTSQKIEGINSKAECVEMGKTFSEQMSRSVDFACVPKNLYGVSK